LLQLGNRVQSRVERRPDGRPMLPEELTPFPVIPR
jgi:hypothetical protein